MQSPDIGTSEDSYAPRKRTKQKSPVKHHAVSSCGPVSPRQKLRKNFPYDDENKKNKKKFEYCIRIWHVLPTALIFVIVMLLIAVGGTLHTYNSPEAPLIPPDPLEPQPPSWSKLKVFGRAAVCMDGEQCAWIGKSILEKNGSAVDAAIAAMICNGLINMQSMGFGGGFFMTIYERSTKKTVTLDARECAPGAASTKIYNDLPPLASQTGPMAIAVPGELAGYWKAHQRFGRLPWPELFEPSIAICDVGYKLTKFQRDSLSMNNHSIHSDPTLRSWFVSEQTGDFHPLGTIVRPVKLCETMRLVATRNASEFYNGNLGKIFIEDLRRRGSILTLEDLEIYRAKWVPPISTRLSTGETLHTVGPPASGAILSFLLNILDGYDLKSWNIATPEATLKIYQRMLEAFKYAYASRMELADPAYVDLSKLLYNLTSRNYADEVRRKISDNETSNDPRHYGVFSSGGSGDHGTAHISILAPNGDAVSVTSSVNIYFGSGVVSERTGILSSSSMDDFGFPSRTNYQDLSASPNNKLEPGKRPQSSMSPSILVDAEGDVRMVIGAAGGTRITTALAYVIARHLWMKETIKEAVDAARIHHQLIPMKVSYEYGVPKPLIDGLRAMGHKTWRYRDRGSVISAIARINGTIYANADYRKGGDVYGLD